MPPPDSEPEQRSAHRLAANRRTVRLYTDQPDAMPRPVRRAIEDAAGGGPVVLYAIDDLDGSMRQRLRWVALTPTHLVLADDAGAESPPTDIRLVERSAIQALRESPALSASTLAVLGDPGEPALAILRYSHRQRRAVENIRYVLEQALEGGEAEHADPDEAYAAAMAQPVADAQAAMKGGKLGVVWRLLGYLGPYRWRVAAGMAAASGMTMAQLLPPFLTGFLIDEVVRPFQSGELPWGDARRLSLMLVFAIAGTALVMEAMAYIRLRTMSVLGENVARDLRDQIYGHLQTLGLDYFSRKQTGSIISRVSSDTDRLWDFIAFGVVEVSLSILKLAGLSIVLLLLDWRLGLLIIVPTPILIYAIFRHGQQMQRLFLRAWRKWSDLTDVLSDTIPGVRVVKAYNQEDRETRRFNTKNAVVVDEFNSIHSVWTRFWPCMMLGIHGLVLMVWAFALPRMIAPDGPTLTIGAFVTFLLYLTMFFQPIEIIGQMARMMNRATSSAHRIFEVLDTEPSITDRHGAVVLDPVEGAVRFEGVKFTYDGLRPILKGIDFDVSAGEMIGLVGPSGAGKTTVTNLIARFYDATEGTIRIDGVDVRDLDGGALRRQIGMVLQDSYLFHGTVVENIRYGRPEASLGEVIAAAKAANVHDFVSQLAHGYDTVVGERGHTLSGGERQRVAIARAILANPRILILDEATSSVDTETERRIQEALDRLVAGRTVFAIAHRLSTLKKADRIFVIDGGRLVEEGRHADLLAREDGVYRRLHQMQQELHEAFAV